METAREDERAMPRNGRSEAEVFARLAAIPSNVCPPERAERVLVEHCNRLYVPAPPVDPGERP